MLLLLRAPTLSFYLPLSLLPPAQESISAGSISWHEYSLPAESLVGESRRLRLRRRQWRRGKDGDGDGERKNSLLGNRNTRASWKLSNTRVEQWRIVSQNGKRKETGHFTQFIFNQSGQSKAPGTASLIFNSRPASAEDCVQALRRSSRCVCVCVCKWVCAPPALPAASASAPSEAGGAGLRGLADMEEV